MKRLYLLLEMIARNKGKIPYEKVLDHYTHIRSAQEILHTLKSKRIVKVTRRKYLFEKNLVQEVNLTEYGYHMLRLLRDWYT